MADIELNNEVVVAIEQYEDSKLISRREAIRYPGLPNMLANQINILLSEGVDAGILPEIEAMRDAKAALIGQTDLVEMVEPVIQSRREERGKEVKARKEGKAKPAAAAPVK